MMHSIARFAAQWPLTISLLIASTWLLMGVCAVQAQVDGLADQPAVTPGEATRAASAPADNRDDRAMQHVHAIEMIHRSDWKSFVDQHFTPGLRESLNEAELQNLRLELEAAAEQAGGAGLMLDNDTFRLTLSGPESRKTVSFQVAGDAPFGISAIEVKDANADLALPEITGDNFEEIFQVLENDDFDGVLYVRINDEELVRAALGYADRNQARAMSTEKIFGIGSQPIDFTVALTYIAAEAGDLSLDDPISNHVNGVPGDKSGMTIRHLVENMSGLPDFVDNETDWDPDLAWMTRDAFIARILAAPLRFEPGARQGHSHAGFSFLAAIVEIATDTPYEAYLKEQILKPAGMTHTGMYGDPQAFALEDFAVGGGPSFIGLPNIPPNWGVTSWLVKGSGGMYSTLEDIIKFTRFVQTSERIPAMVRNHFSGETVNFNGSMRGFEMFEYRRGAESQILVLSNSPMQGSIYRDLTTRLEQFAMQQGQ